MTVEKFGHPPRIDQDKIEALKMLFPDVFSEGKLNLEALKAELSGEGLISDSGEHYGLHWTGKSHAKQLASAPVNGTLIPVDGAGVNEDATNNLLISGDNLEVLRILRNAYSNRIKMIYIDPPYNTGNDFVYKDDFKESVESYLRRTNQTDDQGLLESNPKSSGRFHSDWLTMMYPRLRIARELLREDGVIYVSIDDNECHNLKLLMDEVFGQENFVANVVWHKKFSPQNDAKYFSTSHEHILVYGKTKENWARLLLPRNDESNERYGNPDNDPRGPWASSDLTRMEHRDNGVYTIVSPTTGRQWTPVHGTSWRHPEAEMLALIADNQVWFGPDGNSKPRRKRFLSEVKQGIVPQTLWSHADVGHTQEASQEFKRIFENDRVTFETPKPTRLVQRMLQITSTAHDGDIILDFFAGSGTTGQAVMETNKADGGNRKFICVQLAVPLSDSDFETIFDVTLERLKRKSLELLKSDPKGSFGFKVYKLDRSTINRFNPVKGKNIQQVQQLFESFSPLRVDAQAKDILTEIMLTESYPLDSKVEVAPEFDDNKVFLVTHPERSSRLLVCLDADLLFDSTVEALQHYSKDLFVCLESALTDELKVRVADQVRKAKAI